uniref:Uncharacterized protein n=1 Tax=Lotharella oceanica TaxID=641309 RepID=A0A7S2TZN0_9EUKA|mmetsp:Transcript_37039/g.68371  ORF Transcript_37039/g.68371 Transcript_37039/m.68371 type:complete len:563 (+) Transcript_37039:87-1775(+)
MGGVHCCGNAHPTRRRDEGSRVEEYYDDEYQNDLAPVSPPQIPRRELLADGIGPPRQLPPPAVGGKTPESSVYILASDSEEEDGDHQRKTNNSGLPRPKSNKKTPPSSKTSESFEKAIPGKPGCDSDASDLKEGEDSGSNQNHSGDTKLDVKTKSTHVRTHSSQSNGRHVRKPSSVSRGGDSKRDDETVGTDPDYMTEGDLDIELDLLQQIRIRSRVSCLATPLKGASHLCYAGTSDGRLLLISEGKVAARELHKRAVTAMAPLDSDHVVVGFFDGYVIVYDTLTEDRYELRPTRQKISRVACDPSGRVAVVYGSEVSILSHKKRSQVARINLKKHFKESGKDEVTTVSFVSKKLLVLGTKMGTLCAFSVERQRVGGFSYKIKPAIKYTKKIGRTIRDILVRIDMQKKSPSDFTFRILFDTVSQEGEANTTVVDLSLSSFYSKSQEEHVGVVGVSEMEMRNACMIGGDLLSATKEGLLVWSGDDANGTEKLFMCGQRELGAFAWSKGKLFTTADSSVLVWDLPEELLMGQDAQSEMNLSDFSRSPVAIPVGLPGTNVRGDFQ